MIITGLDLSINSSGLVQLELDDNLDIVHVDFMGFTTVKKNETVKVYHYKKNQFKTYLHQSEWMLEKSLEFVEGSEYVAIEDFSFGSTGKVFQIAEWASLIKYHLFECDVKMRLIDPNSVKMFATGKGNCDKLRMYDSFQDFTGTKPDLKYYPEVTKSNGNSPTSDVVDAFYIAKILQLELKLRKGIIALRDCNEDEIRIFNRVTKSHPVNMLDRDFIQK